MQRKPFRFFLLCFLTPWVLSAQDGFKAVQNLVVEHTLKNGLQFLILPRHDAPVVSFHTYVNVGAVNDSRGITGLAHIFEHLAFKGTTDIGTKDYKKEKIALEALDKSWTAWRSEEIKGPNADSTKLKPLRDAFEKSQEAASALVENGEFDKAIEEQGGIDLNANTGADATQYFLSLPSNKLELWFSLESARFLDPVIRDFYKEKDVVMEERRMRTDNNPLGKLVEEFLAVAYKSHPYKEPAIGHISDLEGITRDEAAAFFKKYYVPSNMVIAIVGDVDPKETIRLAELYFGRIPAGSPSPGVRTVEPEQNSERSVVLREESQRILLVGYKKGSINHPDDAVYEAISDIFEFRPHLEDSTSRSSATKSSPFRRPDSQASQARSIRTSSRFLRCPHRERQTTSALPPSMRRSQNSRRIPSATMSSEP